LKSAAAQLDMVIVPMRSETHLFASVIDTVPASVLDCFSSVIFAPNGARMVNPGREARAGKKSRDSDERTIGTENNRS
jgi:hypothetical protein